MIKRFPTFLATLIIFGSFAPLLASADCQTPGTGSFYTNPISAALNICKVQDLLPALVDLMLLVGTPLVVVFIIYGGFLFVTAGDNEAAIAKAKTVFMWTIIGALVLFGAKAISLGIQATIGSLKA